MDLGIRGKRAIVCAGSRGLGRGSAEKLAEAGVDLVLNARSGTALEETAAAIRARYGVDVVTVAADVTTVDGRAAILAAAPDPDILVNNAGGPPPGVWSDWGAAEWQAALEANMLAPIHMMRAVLPGMIAKRWGRVVNITSASVKSPIAALGLSGAARSGLTGFVAGTARQVAKDGVTINNLLPGLHATARIDALQSANAKASGRPLEEVRAEAEREIPAGRFGTAEEFGAACAFLCSAHAGFIVGQNLLLDGGAFNATMG